MGNTVVIIVILCAYKIIDIFWYGRLDDKLNQIIEKQKEDFLNG